jgi:hypothetical protein
MRFSYRPSLARIGSRLLESILGRAAGSAALDKASPAEAGLSRGTDLLLLVVAVLAALAAGLHRNLSVPFFALVRYLASDRGRVFDSIPALLTLATTGRGAAEISPRPLLHPALRNMGLFPLCRGYLPPNCSIHRLLEAGLLGITPRKTCGLLRQIRRNGGSVEPSL